MSKLETTKNEMGVLTRYGLQYGAGTLMGIAVTKYNVTPEQIEAFINGVESTGSMLLSLAGILWYAYKKYMKRKDRDPNEDFKDIN